MWGLKVTEEKKTKSQLLTDRMNNLENLLTTLTTKINENSAAKAGPDTLLPSPPVKAISQEASVPPPLPHKESAEEHYANCPDCHKKINELARKELEPEILKGYREKVKSIKDPVLCIGCGEIVGKSEKECPTCHGTKARTI